MLIPGVKHRTGPAGKPFLILYAQAVVPPAVTVEIRAGDIAHRGFPSQRCAQKSRLIMLLRCSAANHGVGRFGTTPPLTRTI